MNVAQPNVDLIAEAISYAARGWHVVPDHSVLDGGSCTCADQACKVPGKHPRMDRESAEGHFRGIGSRSPSKLKEWWKRWPDSNIAIVCGASSGLVAVDIDPRNDGLESWRKLMMRYGDCSNTLTSRTGGKGLHLLFAHPGGGAVRNRIGLFPGIDVKADRGRIVAPPSRHKSGERYAWVDFTKTPAPLPNWLFTLIQFQKGTGSWQALRKARGG